MTYFAPTQAVGFRPIEFDLEYADRSLRWISCAGVFSRRELDPGSLALLQAVRGREAERVLDLGCGHGALGLLHLLAAGRGRAWLVDVNPHACRAAEMNRVRLGLPALVLHGDGAAALADASVDLVLSNPPIRAGLPVIRRFWSDAARCLRPGGALAFVGRPRQGVRRLADLASAALGGSCEKLARRHGYEVFEIRRA